MMRISESTWQRMVLIIPNNSTMVPRKLEAKNLMEPMTKAIRSAHAEGKT